MFLIMPELFQFHIEVQIVTLSLFYLSIHVDDLNLLGMAVIKNEGLNQIFYGRLTVKTHVQSMKTKE